MDFERLRRKGWTENELAHAAKVLSAVPTQIDHITLWLLVGTLAFGGIGVAMLLLPIVLFGNLFSIPLGLLLGMCLGLMLTHSLRSLRIERKHHMRAFLFLVCVTFISSAISLQLMQQRFTLLIGEPHNVLLMCVPLIIGMIIPYLAERRIHGTA